MAGPITVQPFGAGTSDGIVRVNIYASGGNITNSLQNPMTTLGDIIYGGVSGFPTRLPVGSATQVLTVSGGIPSWQTFTGSFTNTAANNELIKSNGTNGVPSGLFSSTLGDLVLGRSTVSGSTRNMSVAGTATDITLIILTKGLGDFDVVANNVLFALQNNVNIGSTGINLTQNAIIGSTGNAFFISGGNHTTLTASSEYSDVQFQLARTIQYSTGNLSQQRVFQISAPTIGFVGSSTITDAATIAISNLTKAGTNAIITNSHGLWIQASSVTGAITNSYGLTVNAQTGATNNYAAQFLGGKVLFNSSTTTAGLKINGFTADPSVPVEGDLTYNTTSHLFKFYNGTAWVSASGTITPPAGSTTQIQFNSSGAFGASSNFTWNNSGQILNVGDGTSTGLAILNDSISHLNPTINFGIGVADNAAGNGGTFLIGAGNSTGSNGNGGNLFLSPGSKNGTGIAGSVYISCLDNVNSPIYFGSNAISGGPVLTLASSSTNAGLTLLMTKGSGATGTILGTGLVIQSTGTLTLSSSSRLILTGIPTSSAGLPTGAVWSNSNVLTIVP